MATLMGSALLKRPEGLYYHGGAVLYAVLGYMLGLAGLFASSLVVQLASMLLLLSWLPTDDCMTGLA